MRIGVIISDEPRINDEIRVSQVRLIGPNGEQVGVIATSVALNLAKEANLDLVEVAPNAKPPVAKLIDYGKYKYNEKIKAREARRNQSTAEIKEIRFRLKIDDHDFEVKKGHVVRFLNGGDKVKVTIMLRGREQSRPIGGVELLQRLASEVEEYGTVEFAPKQEGRNIIMTLAPKGKKVHTQSEQRRRGDQSRAERQARQAARLAVCKINIDSDLRLAMTGTIRQFFAEHPDKFDPREYLKPARANIKEMVKHKLIHVLGCDGKA